MFDVYFVTLRETAEVLLLLIAMIAYLPHADRRLLLRRLVLGAGAGSIAGIALPALLSRTLDPLADAILAVAFGIFLAAMAVGVLASSGRIGQWVRLTIDTWAGRLGWPAATMVVAAVVTFREAFELTFYVLRHVGRLGWPAVSLGVGAGIATAVILPIIGYLLKLQGHLSLAFRVSALLLCYFALGMVVSGLLDLARELEVPLAQAAADGLGIDMMVGALMIVPTYLALRDWWTEADDDGRRGRPTQPLRGKDSPCRSD